jgi:ABC-type branched-subunit amino acid transport system permease subunit
MDAYLIAIGTFIGFYAMLALALNVQWGFTGLVNLGHVGFFAIGAYGTALLTVRGAPFLAGMIASVLLAACLGSLVAMATLRLKEDFLTVVTLGFSEIVRLFLINEDWLTRGTNGISGIPRPFRHSFLRGYDLFYLLIVAAVVAVLFFVLERLRKSPYGRVLKAIREDEEIASVAGKNVFRFKVQAFTLGAAIAGLSGFFYAHYITFISPDTFVPSLTIYVWVALIAGGSGNNKGAILGAVVLMGFLEGTRFLKDFIPFLTGVRLAASREILVGTLLILLMHYKQEGILPEERMRPKEALADPSEKV